MKLIDTYSGKVIAAITTDHGLTLDEAIYRNEPEDTRLYRRVVNGTPS